MPTSANIYNEIYYKLLDRYGPQNWWPGDSPLEIIIGAILTQNTAWTNVEKAILNLKNNKFFTPIHSAPKKFRDIKLDRLAGLIRSAGYHNIKAKRIKNFIRFLDKRYGLSMASMASSDTDILRDELLSINGIGPETCDSILLYAFKKPVFVIDTYTKRVFSRHGIFCNDIKYHAAQNIFMKNIKNSESIYNEYHALIVRLCKEVCKAKPNCDECILRYLPRR